MNASAPENDGSIPGSNTKTHDPEKMEDSSNIEAGEQVTMHVDPELEKRVRRKMDLHLIPLVSAAFLLSFLDRSNIGYGSTIGLIPITNNN